MKTVFTSDSNFADVSSWRSNWQKCHNGSGKISRDNSSTIHCSMISFAPSGGSLINNTWRLGLFLRKLHHQMQNNHISNTSSLEIQQSCSYVNPICCVATVCHQVRCMYWGHLGHFYRAISHLKWYKIVCMRYLACTFSQMKSINMFSMFLQSGVPRHFLWKFIGVWIYNLTVFMFMHVNVDLKH